MNHRISNWQAVCVAAIAILCGTGAGAQDSTAKQESIEEAQKLAVRVDTLFKAAQYTEAIPIAARVVSIREKELGPKDPLTAASLFALGRLYHASGDYTQAESLYQRALAIREKVLGQEHPDTTKSLNNLAMLYQITGAYGRSEALYKRTITIREKVLGPEHLDTARSLNNLAVLYIDTEYYLRAEPLLQRALAIYEKALGPEDSGVAEPLTSLADLYISMGAYAQAEPLIRRALAIREKAQGPEHPDTAFALTTLAMLLAETGAYTQAEPLFVRALAIREKVFGPEHPNTAISLTNLAFVYAHSGDYAKAVTLYQRALAIQEKVLGPEHQDTALSLNNLAMAYADTGDYAQAEPMFRRALAINEKALGPNNPATAETLSNLAELYANIGNYSESETLYQRAVSIREKALGPEHPTTAKTFGSLAALRWSMDQPAKALPLLRHAQMIQAKNSAQFLLSGSETRKHEYVQALEKDTHKYVSFSVSVPGRESVALGLNSVLLYKGRVLDTMSDSVSRMRQSVRAKDRALFEQLAQVANEFSILAYQGPGNLSAEEYRKRLHDLAGQQEKLEAELAKRSGEFREQITPVTVATVRRAIPVDAALVEWFRYIPFDPKATGLKSKQLNPRYMAYVLKRDVDPVAVDVGDAHTIESAAHEFRFAASDSKHGNVKASATALSELLLKPLRTYLKATDHLLISPDGALNLVPMAALLDERGEYLAQHFEISYLTSGRDLLRFDFNRSSHNSPIVMADPAFGNITQLIAQASPTSQSQRSADLDRGGLIFRPLVNTALEAQDIRKLLNLNASSVLLREEATEANLKQLHGPRILHVASHGFFLSDRELTVELKKRTMQSEDISGENPLLRSGIALAGANARHSGENNDGILTALEVAQLDLHGTELVVLSACDSGVGDVQNGEGIYGLRRALVLAGAQSQVTSLWKVSDEATRMLMVDYYQRLLNGEGRSAALLHAQQAMLANPELSHPYYWASFVPIGNWTPLSTQR